MTAISSSIDQSSSVIVGLSKPGLIYASVAKQYVPGTRNNDVQIMVDPSKAKGTLRSRSIAYPCQFRYLTRRTSHTALVCLRTVLRERTRHPIAHSYRLFICDLRAKKSRTKMRESCKHAFSIPMSCIISSFNGFMIAVHFILAHGFFHQAPCPYRHPGDQNSI
jgi:hypothetical protein